MARSLIGWDCAPTVSIGGLKKLIAPRARGSEARELRLILRNGNGPGAPYRPHTSKGKYPPVGTAHAYFPRYHFRVSL